MTLKKFNVIWQMTPINKGQKKKAQGKDYNTYER